MSIRTASGAIAAVGRREDAIRNETVRIDFWTLNFSSESLEAEFRLHHVRAFVRRFRFMCIAGGLAMAVLILLNAFADKKLDNLSLILRAAIVVLLQVVMGISYLQSTYERIMTRDWVLYFCASIMVLLIISGRIVGKLSGSASDSASDSANSVGASDMGFLFVVLAGLCTLTGLRYTPAVVAATSGVLWFSVAVAIWGKEKPEPIVVSVLALLVFCYVARDYELSERRDFTLTSRLRKEKVSLTLQLEGFSWFRGGAHSNTGIKISTIEGCIVDPSQVELRRTLGAGGFGEVKEGRWRQTEVAVKVLSKTISEDVMREFHEEAMTMAQMRHPNVVMFLGLCVFPPMLIMELMPRGSVHKVIHEDNATLHWTLVLQMVVDTALGMNFLHTHPTPILHRDLKSLNLLVARDWRVKVSDFGLSRLLQMSKEHDQDQPGTHSDAARGGATAAAAAAAAAPTPKPLPAGGEQKRQAQERNQHDIGTLAWTAPEVFAGSSISEKVDVYSFGVILFEFLCRQVPFKAQPAHSIPYLVLKGVRPTTYAPLKDVDPNLQALEALMHECWSPEPARRPSFEAVLQRMEAIRKKQISLPSGTFADHVVLPSTSNTQQAPSPAPAVSGPGFTINMKDVELGPKIGRGGNAVVYEGLYRGTHVAVKELLVRVAQDELMQEFQKECSLMIMLRHPNIVLFMGSGQRNSKLYMITELMVNGSLFQIYHQHARDSISLTRRLSMAADAVRGMQYLHSLDPPLIHRDLKSPNVLVDNNWVAKIADFGLSRFKDDTKTMTTCGSPLWAAPEVLRGERFGEPCDVFSFAIILWELLAWEEPYAGMESLQVMTQVARYKLRPRVPPAVPPRLARLLVAMWDDDQHQRPTFEQVLIQLEDIIAPSE